jgi:hypothetical protein
VVFLGRGQYIWSEGKKQGTQGDFMILRFGDFMIEKRTKNSGRRAISAAKIIAQLHFHPRPICNDLRCEPKSMNRKERKEVARAAKILHGRGDNDCKITRLQDHKIARSQDL